MSHDRVKNSPLQPLLSVTTCKLAGEEVLLAVSAHCGHISSGDSVLYIATPVTKGEPVTWSATDVWMCAWPRLLSDMQLRTSPSVLRNTWWQGFCWHWERATILVKMECIFILGRQSSSPSPINSSFPWMFLTRASSSRILKRQRKKKNSAFEKPDRDDVLCRIL